MRKVLTFCLTLLLIAALALPAFAVSTAHVVDDANLLTDQERGELEAYARQITQTYGIGIYILTVDDYRDYYGAYYEIFDVLWNYYHDNDLGFGADREGMILMLSMRERDYATFFYGENTEYAFNSYGQEQLEEYFLDNLQYNDWYGGFHDYLAVSEEYMALASAGDPVRESPWGLAILFIAVACGISLIVTGIQWSQMKNVRLQRSAENYQVENGFRLTRNRNIFLHRDVIRRKIENNSGSRSHSGGGGSGRSGKF